MSKFKDLPGWLQALIALIVISVGGVAVYNLGYNVDYELGQNGSQAAV